MPSIAGRAKKALKDAYLRAKSATIIDRNRETSRAVFLAGGSRSGTTWISELINYDNSYRFVFEPFGVRQLGNFWYGSYIRPGNADPALRDLARFVFSGAFHDPWSDQFNKRMIAERRLVKEVRANLWVAWLRRQFPEIPIVFLLRHPIPTVWSRFKRYFEAKDRAAVDTDPVKRTADYKSYLMDQSELVADYLEPFKDAINAAQTPWEQRLFTWCVQYYVPLRQLRPGDAHIMFYENVCMDPEGEMRRMSEFIGRGLDESFHRKVWKPSSMTNKRQMPDPKSLVEGWRKKVSAEEVRRAVEILHLFGLDAVYSADPMPNADGLAALSRAAAVEHKARPLH